MFEPPSRALHWPEQVARGLRAIGWSARQASGFGLDLEEVGRRRPEGGQKEARRTPEGGQTEARRRPEGGQKEARRRPEGGQQEARMRPEGRQKEARCARRRPEGGQSLRSKAALADWQSPLKIDLFILILKVMVRPITTRIWPPGLGSALPFRVQFGPQTR